MQALSPTNAFTLPPLEPLVRPAQSGASTTVTADSVGVVKAADTQTQQAVPAIAQNNSTEKIKESIQKVNDMVKTMGRELEFSVDEETHLRLVKVVDTQTHEVIRQFPSEEVVQIAKALDRLQGLLIKDKV